MLFYFLALFTQTVIYSGCCADRICYNISNMSLTAYDNAGLDPIISTDEPVIGEALMLNLKFDYNEEGLCYNKPLISFLNTAYARSCPEVQQLNDDISNIVLTADKDYDAKHPAGTPLNDCFDMPNSINQVNDEGYHLLSLKAPAVKDTFTFSVTITSKNMGSLSASSQPVILLP